MGARVIKSGESRVHPWNGKKSLWISLAILLGLVGIALLPASPLLYKTPNNDYSIFLYVGREMVHGKLLYQDVYDHKPPLIFLINAVGVLLGGDGMWGVWAIEMLSLVVATLLAFLFLDRYFGRLPAMVASAAMLVNLAIVHERGNLTEEYAYPFQFAALFLLASAQKAGRTARQLAGHYLAIGILLGLASSLKQPLAGIALGMAVFLAFDYLGRPEPRWRDLFRALLWMAVGAVSVWLVWFAFFAAAGIFPEFWEAVFLLNFRHSSHSTPERLQALIEAIRWLIASSGFFFGGLLIWLTVSPYLILYDCRVLPLLSGRRIGAGIIGLGLLFLYNGLFRTGSVMYAFRDLSTYRFSLIISGVVLVGLGLLFISGRAGRTIRGWMAQFTSPNRSELALPLIIALVDLPIALGLAILTGNNFPHYFMPLIPSLVILFAYGGFLLLQAANSPPQRVLAYVWLAALMLPVFIPGIMMTFKQLHQRGDRQVEDTAAYLKANTLPEDPVLLWGISSSVYILSKREAPTRYFTTNPLFFDGYSGEWQTSRFLADLRARPPTVIIDTQMARLPLVTSSLDPAGTGWHDCKQVQDLSYYQSFLAARLGSGATAPQFPAGMGDVYEWICQNYQPVGPVGELNWQVYRRKGK